MSNKKPLENPNIIIPSQTNNNIPPNTDAFSFLELDNFLSQEITKKENNNTKKNQKKKLSQEKKIRKFRKKAKIKTKTKCEFSPRSNPR